MVKCVCLIHNNAMFTFFTSNEFFEFKKVNKDINKIFITRFIEIEYLLQHTYIPGTTRYPLHRVITCFMHSNTRETL